MKKIIVALLLVTLIMGLSACGSKKDDSGNSAKAGDTTTDTNRDLVNVGKNTINESQLNQNLELTSIVQNFDLTQFPAESLKAIKSQMLTDMITMECIRQYYAGQEKKVLPATIEADLKSFMDEARNTDSINSVLEKKNITEDTLKTFFYNQYYRNAYIDEVKAGMTNLDKDAKAYYEANKASFTNDKVTASHILVADEALAKEILAKLKAGDKFEDLAKKYSTDPGSKDNGGSLGTFGRGDMVTEFENAAFALKPGEISDIVKTQFGYHIIKVSDKNQGTKTFDEAKEDIISTLVNQEAEKKTEALKESIGVKYLTKDYTGEAKKQ